MEGWKRLLEDIGPGEIILRVPESDEAGLLFGRLRLPRDCRLDVYLRLEFKDLPRLLTYSLQLMDARGGCIVRYDNAAHYGNLPGAPHHLHVGEAVFPVQPEPSLRSMLAAIRAEVERI